MSTGFIRIVNQLGYKRKFLSPNHVRIEIPGLAYTSFDAFENPFPWTVMNMLDSAQTCCMHGKGDDPDSILGVAQHYDHKTAYTVAARVEFYPQLYNKRVVKSPLEVDNKVTHIGNTSVFMKAEMKVGQYLLSSLVHQTLCVDDVTKRPIPVPDWLKKNFEKHGTSSEPIRFPVLEKPSNLKRRDIGRVKYSDVDSNFHLNFSNYLKFCVDGVYEEAAGQQMRCRLLKSAFTWYRNECLLGESLHIDYWQNTGEENKYYVDLMKEDESRFQCILEFYGRDELKSLL